MNEVEEKRLALDIITRHYSEGNAEESFVYPEQKIANTVIIKVKIESLTGRSSGARTFSWIYAALTRRLTHEILNEPDKLAQG